MQETQAAESSPVIHWTREKLGQFKRAEKASREDVFLFEGHEFFRYYARYLIEYLEGKLT